MIEHLIFDFDGTISDSYPIFQRIIHQIADDHGLTVPCDEKSLNRWLRVSVGTAVNGLHWDQQMTRAEFSHEFHIWQERYALEFTAFPEAVELLEYAKACGKKLYIYTHSGDVVHKILKNMGLDSYFTYVLTASKGFPAKPAPDALLFLAKECSLDPRTCMMIGDRPIDAQAGVRAGMTGVLWDADGWYTDEGIDYRIPFLQDIKKLI